MSDAEAWEERQRREGVLKEETELSMGHGDDYYGPDPMTHLLMAWQCMIRLGAPEEMRRATMKIIHALGDLQVNGELLGDEDMDFITVTDAGYGHRRKPKKRSGSWIPRDSTQY